MHLVRARGGGDSTTAAIHRPKVDNNCMSEFLPRIRAAIDTLEAIVADRGLIGELSSEERRRLIHAAALVINPDTFARRRMVKAIAKRQRAERAKRDDAVLAGTGIRRLRRRPAVTTPNVFPPSRILQDEIDDEQHDRDAVEPQHCYICKQPYAAVHHFYDRLCPACGDFNFAKRTELADLRGSVALLTGGRVKIGYQAGLKLLRSGAHLIVTTRFPRNAATRYAGEPDFGDWKDRLEIHGLDLRHLPSVEAFCRELVATRSRLDFVINNACQTVRRPPSFYAHMMDEERSARRGMPAAARHLLDRADESAAGLARRRSEASGVARAAELSQLALLPEDEPGQDDLFPEGRLDLDLQQVDLRGRNSWRLLLDEVSSVELLEVQMVNAIAPFIINARLKALMLRTPNRDKHIVNVSAVEGQFYRNFKTTRHPHTNMAKAALNMMTRTSATDYQSDGIHMNSVDTGWVTDEDADEIAARKTRDHRFHPPLDAVDGAARIVDPIVSGINSGTHVWGQFLKDYRPTPW